MKIQLEIWRNKKVFAKKPLTFLYEMNSWFFMIFSKTVFVVITLAVMRHSESETVVLFQLKFLFKQTFKQR